jgi:DNA polymerase III epsilon subunit-like protein
MQTGSRAVVVDCETGGLDPAKHPITQIAAIAVNLGDWSILEKFEVKLAFDEELCDMEALAKTSYQKEVWEQQAMWPAQARNILAEFFRRHATLERISKKNPEKPKPYKVARLVAHNAPFDCGFIQELFARSESFCPASTYEPLDTLALARWVCSLTNKPLPASNKLVSLAEWLGVDVQGIVDARTKTMEEQHMKPHPNLGFHDAFVDALVTVEVAKQLSARFSDFTATVE